MEFKGRIYKLFPVQTGKSAKGSEWQKQDFIFEYFEHDTDRWSDKVLLSVMNDRISEYDLHEGDEVVCGFGHNVKEWNGKWFNDVRCYKIEKVVSAQLKPTSNGVQQNLFTSPTTPPQAPQSTQAASVGNSPTPQPTDAQNDGDGELPF